MEKNTRSSRKISEKKRWFAAHVGRFTLAALLVSAVVFVALPDLMRAGIASQLNYRTASFSAGASPTAAKIGDLDGDGLNDIAVVNIQGNLQLFFNNGAGSFNRVSINGLWSSSSNTLDVDIGDLNRDGRNDIAVAFSTQRGAVSVLFNQGNRTFTAPVNYDLCNSSKGVAIGDLDQDGDNDLADISQCSRSGILVNNGHGGFTLNGTYGSGTASRSIGLGDFNRDGFKDIAYINGNVNGSVTVVLNNRNATFGSPSLYYAGDLPDALTVGDFDGDGADDVAIANSYYSQVIFLLGDGHGSFYSYSELTAGDTPTGIASADFNGDGLLDVAVTSFVTNTLTIAINRGNYNFDRPVSFSVGQSPIDIEAGKLDGDSLPDLVSVNQSSGSITVLFSAVGTPPTTPPTTPPATITVSTRKTNLARFVDLRWSGATAQSLEIYRNGSRIATVSNNGSYTDQMNRRATGTFRYKVCVAGSQTCSNEASVSF
ncbi:MAG: VCBS repeat-containing protein [Blastocatellia bacterium]